MGDLRRRAIVVAAAGLAAAPTIAWPQSARKVARVGWLGIRDEQTATSKSIQLEGLRAGLRERGWVEGVNLHIEMRSATFANAQELATELKNSGAELIVAQGGMIFRIRALAETTPLLFQVNGDPVEAKLVASYARPGGNMTGVTALSESLSGKRVELLKEALPNMTRFAAIANQGHPGWRVEFDATHAAAKQLGLALKWLPVFSPQDFGAALEAAAQDGAQGIVAVPDNLILNQAKLFAGFAAKRGIPAISGFAEFAEAGNLMSYGPALRDVYIKLASYADKLLRGAKPADLPVENPTRFEMTVNLKTAKAMGLKIPQSLLVRADRVIE